MPKQAIIIGVIVLLLVGGGAYMLLGNKVANPTQDTATTTASSESSGVFGSIQEALSKSISLQCEYTDEENMKTTAYISAGSVRADMTGGADKQTSSMIMKDEKLYIWSGNQGMMMDLSGVEENGSSDQSVKQQSEEVMEDLEKYKDNCKPATVDSSLFTPPSDVTFSDFSKMMQPKTGTSPGAGGMTQEQIEALQKQYQQ